MIPGRLVKLTLSWEKSSRLERTMELSEDQRKELEERLRSMSPEELKEYQKKQCIFCRMVTGEIPAKKIYEDEKVFAILDINPAAAGHLLLLPKEHVMVMQQMPDADVEHLFLVARSFSQSFLQVLHAEGSTMFCASGQAAGQRAQHVMLHIIPRKEGDNIGIKPKMFSARSTDLEMIAKALRPFCEKEIGVGGKMPPVPESKVKAGALMQGAPPALPAPGGSPHALQAKQARREKREKGPSKRKEPKAGAETSSLDDITKFLAGS